MRIAFVHSFYGSGQPSGENGVVQSEIEALSRAGHRVELFAARTDELESAPGYRVTSALRVATGRGRSPLGGIRAFAPHVVHVHNLFPNFGRRWATELRVPLVATLHNYRPLCVNGFLFRQGHVCTLCPQGRPFAGVRHACYRGSRMASLPQALANRGGPRADPLLRRADRVVVLSRASARLYRDAGVDQAKLVVWPNFLSADLDPGPMETGKDPSGWLYVGRLSPEKGILRLVERWPADRPLQIVGDGPESDSIRKAATGKRVEVLEAVGRSAVLRLMRSAVGMVFPSAWFESFPLVYAEAMAAGLPVLAWEPNVVAELVRTDGTGTRTTWKEDLAGTLARAEMDFPDLRVQCRRVFDRQYSEAAYLVRAEALYQELADVSA